TSSALTMALVNFRISWSGCLKTICPFLSSGTAMNSRLKSAMAPMVQISASSAMPGVPFAARPDRFFAPAPCRKGSAKDVACVVVAVELPRLARAGLRPFGERAVGRRVAEHRTSRDAAERGERALDHAAVGNDDDQPGRVAGHDGGQCPV